jgi:diguanylate cyclase (GGDEF)-like protein
VTPGPCGKGAPILPILEPDFSLKRRKEFRLDTSGQTPLGSASQDLSAAQIERSYGQLPISLVINLVNGLILTTVLWVAIDASRLLAWLLLLMAVTAARFMVLRAFKKAAHVAKLDHAAWRRRFVAGGCAAGVVWGAAGVFLFHPDSFPHQVFLAFVLGGMVAGAIPLLSSVDHAYPCFAVPAVLPICIQMFALGDYVHLTMGLMAAIFGIGMLASSVQVRRLFRDSDKLRHELFSSIAASQELEQMVRLDVLTGIANRRLFEEELEKEWRRAERDRVSLSVITADIDHFKEYNDHYGHPAGDRCLIVVAQAMQKALCRPGDVVARIGGEEFAFLLPRTTLDGAKNVAELMRRRILELNLPHGNSPVARQVTLSFGIASSEDVSVDSAADLLRASDMALYEAKRGGRNEIAMIAT